MKLIEYPYIPGQLQPADVVMGGMFSHAIDGVTYFVGAVPDDYASPALTRAYVLSIINECDPFQVPIPQETCLSAYLADLGAAGYTITWG
jgi:hypothetical protein